MVLSNIYVCARYVHDRVHVPRPSATRGDNHRMTRVYGYAACPHPIHIRIGFL